MSVNDTNNNDVSQKVVKEEHIKSVENMLNEIDFGGHVISEIKIAPISEPTMMLRCVPRPGGGWDCS